MLDALFFNSFNKKFPNYSHNTFNNLKDPKFLAQIGWLTSHFYFSGLDKSSQTVVVMCKYAIRTKALERFSSSEFSLPNQSLTSFIDYFLNYCTSHFPFLQAPSSPSLPYFMAIYKIHKDSFRWLTNAHDCLFSPITNFITSGLKGILTIIKDFTQELHSKLKTFSQVETNALWLMNHNMTSWSISPTQFFLATPLMSLVAMRPYLMRDLIV